MKKFFKFLLLMFLFCISYIVSNSILPYSQSFKDISGKVPSNAIIFMSIYALWNAGFVIFVASKSALRRSVTAGILFIYIFSIQFVLTQIETMFFGDRFSALTTNDIWLLGVSGIIPSVIIAIAGSVMFCKKNRSTLDFQHLKIGAIIKKLTLISFLYVVIYFIFGYFVAWQFADLRLFYADTIEKVSFMSQLLENIRTNPMIYPFQLLRGFLFGMSALMLFATFNKDNKNFIIANTIGFSAIGIVLLIPNPLFPEMVRLAHFLEVTSSMLLFGFITGKILTYRTK